MRLLYYAMGGGLGHLVRARAFLHTLGLAADAVVLTASAHARDARVAAGLELLLAPAELQDDAARLRDWLANAIERLAIDRVCVDAFPAGLLGELCNFVPPRAVEWWHVARLLRWDAYAPLLRGAPPRHARVFRLEPLHAAHQAFLDTHCARIEELELIDEADGAPSPVRSETPYWLVVHSGPAGEVEELIAYADELRVAERSTAPLWIASLDPPTRLPAHAHLVHAFPAQVWFAGAERIVSAAGFNLMRQTRAFRGKQSVLPLPRRYDDQFERARRAFSAAP